MIFERGFFHTYYVIQTTKGRKNLGNTHVDVFVYAPEILRFALNDKLQFQNDKESPS